MDDLDALLPIADFLPDRIGFTANVIVRTCEKVVLDKFGINLAEWRIMAMLNEAGTTTSKVISARTGMHKTKVSRAVAELERRALVTRRPNRNDLRESLLSLTEDGVSLAQQISPGARDFSRHLWEQMDAEQQSALEGLLALLVENANSYKAKKRSAA